VVISSREDFSFSLWTEIIHAMTLALFLLLDADTQLYSSEAWTLMLQQDLLCQLPKSSKCNVFILILS